MADWTPEFLVYAFISYVVFLFSTTCHEAAHALVAKLGGDSTAALAGQVTLNPVPHIRREPWGMVIVPIAMMLLAHGSMIGWASAPFNMDWERRHPRRAALMALAGPATNYTLMLIAAGTLRLASYQGWLHSDPLGRPDFATLTLLVLFSLNLLLGTFNLVPVPPLDGNTAVTIFMSDRAALHFISWTRSQGLGMAGLLLAWVLYDRIFETIFRVAIAALYPGSHWG